MPTAKKANNKRRTSEPKDRVLLVIENIAEGYNFVESCRMAGSSEHTVYSFIDKDKALAAKLKDATKKRSRKRLERMRGKLVECWEKAPDDPRYQSSLFFALKAAAPEEFCEKITLKGDMTPEDYARELKKILSASNGKMRVLRRSKK